MESITGSAAVVYNFGNRNFVLGPQHGSPVLSVKGIYLRRSPAKPLFSLYCTSEGKSVLMSSACSGRAWVRYCGLSRKPFQLGGGIQ